MNFYLKEQHRVLAFLFLCLFLSLFNKRIFSPQSETYKIFLVLIALDLILYIFLRILNSIKKNRS